MEEVLDDDMPSAIATQGATYQNSQLRQVVPYP